MYRKLVLFTMFMASLVAAANASDVTTSSFLVPTPNDQSIHYLGMIFGQVGNVLTNAFPSAMMSKIFTIYNYGFLTFAAVLIAYTLSFNLVNELTTGQPLAGTYDVVTVGRIILGNSFLLPTYGGYSFIQVLYMQIVVLGVGLGDNLWSGLIEKIPSSGILNTVQSAGDNTSFITDSVLGKEVDVNVSEPDATIINLFAMTVCAQAQYRHDKVAASGEIISPTDYQWLCSNDQCVVGKRTTDSSGQTKGDCGKIKLESVACSSSTTNDCLSGIEYSSAINAMNSTLTALWPYTDSWFNSLMTQSGTISVDNMISYPSSGISPGNIDSYLGNVTLNYYYALEQLAYSTTTDADSGSASGIYTIEDSSNAGWISAGRYIANPPTSLNTSTTTVFEPETFKNMMFKVEEFIPIFTPNWCSSSVCYISDTYYQQIAEANLNGRYQWNNDDFKRYITNTASYIEEYTSALDGGGDASQTSGESNSESNADQYLDTAVSILYNYWLKYGKGDGPYGDFNLDLQSSVTKFSVFAQANFSKVDIGVYQRNLYVLLNRVLEDVTGLKYFSDDNSQSYASVSQNGSISELKAKCGNLSEPDGCFESLVQNKESLVKEGSGFIGVAVAVHEGNSVNPLSSAQFMGLQMLKHSLGNMTQTVSDIMDLNEELSLAYFGAMMGIQMVYLPIFSLNAFVFQFTPVGPYIDQIIGGAVDSLIKMITFYQRLDYVYVSLYQPLAGTLAQIMVSVGFIIGVYVAAIPTIYYLLGALSWLLSVIEGMVGAPLIALGMTVPRAGTLLGNAESSIVFLLKIFITPALLLCGLIAGLLLSNVMLGLLNQAMIGFITGFLTSFSELGSGATTLVAVGLFSIFYAYIISSIVSNSYSIVFRLIDRTMQYIGGQVEQSGLEEMAKQTKGDLGSVGRAGAAGQPQVGNVEAGGMSAAKTETKGEKRGEAGG